MKTYPLKCRITNSADVTRVDVYDDIGEGGWFSEGLTAKSFAATLGGVSGALEVHINSGGGDVFDGIAIGNAIRAHKGPVTTIVDGLAASIASVIAQAGADRVVQPGSMMMIHDAFGMCVGNEADMAKMAKTLGEVSGNIADIYASRSGLSAGYWRDRMRDETWYTAQQAIDAGLADRFGEGAAELPQGLDVAAYAVPGRIAAALRSLPVASDVTHATHPYSGTHGHAHDDGDGGQHAHDHQHDNDGDHDHHTETDPDGDGDANPPVPAAWHGGRYDAGFDGALRHISCADADESAWDGSAAMSKAAKSENPAAAYKAICAGRRDGDPDKQSSWALPHHSEPGAAPNAAGVRNALARLPQTQGLTNADAAKAHLEAHMRAISPDDGEGQHDRAGTPLAWTPDAFRSALITKEGA